MPSQFFGLNIAESGLRNSNAALNTTANNIANVQTEGYSRQQVDSQAANALRTFTTYGCAGAGVETMSIERIRDSFYDVKFWNNNSEYGQYASKAYFMKTMEDYLNDDGSTGFVSVFNNFYSCLEAITTNASSVSTKSQFVASAEALTDYFNGVFGNLQELQKDINLEIKECVDEINSISEQVATLSKQINVIEISGGTANDLRDKRDLLIDTLSEYIDVDVNEYPIKDSNDPTRVTGGTRYVVKVAAGQILVDASDYSELKYVARAAEEKINQTDADGLYRITWENGNEFNLNNAAMNGRLRGLVELRDGNNATNFTGKVISFDSSDPSNQKVVVKTDAEYLKSSLTDSELPLKGQINIGDTLQYYKDWSFDPATGEYTFIMDETKTGGTIHAQIGAMAKTQDPLNYQGIPYYMTQFDSFLRSFLKAVNDTFCAGYNSAGEHGAVLFTCETAVGHQLTQAELEGGYPNPATSELSTKYGYYYMTAGNVCINKEMLENADLLGTRHDVAFGVEECDQVKKVISMLSDKKQFNFRNAPANQMLEMILSDVALNASNANTNEKTFDGLKTSIDNQRTSISGVDEDEEAVSLVKYQNAYTLASKMIQTLTEIYDQLILNTGV